MKTKIEMLKLGKLILQGNTSKEAKKEHVT